MSFTYRFLNIQKEPDTVSFSLIISDDDGDEGFIEHRIEKVFKVDPASIDAEFLHGEARKEIERIKNELTQPVIDDTIITEESTDGNPS